MTPLAKFVTSLEGSRRWRFRPPWLYEYNHAAVSHRLAVFSHQFELLCSNPSIIVDTCCSQAQRNFPFCVKTLCYELPEPKLFCQTNRLGFLSFHARFSIQNRIPNLDWVICKTGWILIGILWKLGHNLLFYQEFLKNRSVLQIANLLVSKGR